MPANDLAKLRLAVGMARKNLLHGLTQFVVQSGRKDFNRLGFHVWGELEPTVNANGLVGQGQPPAWSSLCLGDNHSATLQGCTLHILPYGREVPRRYSLDFLSVVRQKLVT